MSNINHSKTEMIKGKFHPEQEDLLIQIKLSKKEEKREKEHLQYEKLRHRLKKKITEKIMDKLAKVVQENANDKDIHVFSSLNTKSDSKGLYQRLKKVNKSQNEPHKLKACFINWLYKTPNLVEKIKKRKKAKSDRNKKIIAKFYHFQNSSNVSVKTTDMTTKRKLKMENTKKLPKEPKYKYNYSSNNSNISYNKFEYGGNDPNKGNLYLGKRNGDASYYHDKNYNNFGSLTIIQHNIDNTKKNINNNRFFRDMEYTRATNKSQERRNELTVGSKSMRNSNSSSMIFLNSYGGSRPQKSGESRMNDELKREIPFDRQRNQVWTVRKETYECKEVF
jgi:hypothetical protein